MRETTDKSVGNHAVFAPVQPQSSATYDDFVMARLDPDNRIGTGGEDLLSRNFNWSMPLVGMAGRAGLNLGLSLSYNSLVWTRSGNYITYDADNGYPTPGFRLGFPVIYGQHYNSHTGTYGYLMLMPSGGRVELRRIGSTNAYETADSSYLHLVDNGNGTLLVRSTDGTQLSYSSTTNGFRCTQVKDRNGNYITITNSSAGRLLTVTDTLGRVFNFNYDTNNNLTSISQTRGAGQYTWVTFGYTNLTLQTNFTGLTSIGTQSGTTLPVLTQVGMPDGTYSKFSYNTWGQVYKITNYAADSNPSSDSHALNYVSYNLPLNATTALTDSPRFTQRRDWAENWNNSAEAVSNYAVPSATSWTMPDTSQHTGTFCQMQTPDGTYYNVYLHSSGWDEGMPILVNTWANNDQQQLVLQRTEATARTQDNTGVGYILNPRVTETNVYDPSGNRKRTTVSYSTSFGLPVEVKEYAENASSVVRTTQTDYNLSSDYTNRRIIGLASQKRLYDTANGNALVSKVDFIYDDTGEFLVQQGSPIQHDATNYGTSHTWRGNLTKVKRWDVINTLSFVESKIGYNTTGSTIFSRDPLNHQVSISYADAFSDVGNMNTYALPTGVTDPDGNQSSSLYSYNVGLVTRRQGPQTNVASPSTASGAYVTYSYDTIGRLYQVTNSFNTASTTHYYPTTSNVVQTFTTIETGLPATVSAKMFDGAGQVRAIAAEHPGSDGGYVGQYFVFDVMGRQIQQTNPTEIYGSWSPAGDDSAGWIWNTQTYDWKGRPRVTTNQDGTTREAGYGGCGCAGGEIVTMRDEINRYTKVYHDVLGRVTKSEELNWDQTVYRTRRNEYNARDQVTTGIAQQGSSGTVQTSAMTYDGYGRLATRHLPIQSSATSYTYNADDTLATTTDARGVIATFAYNIRQLVTGVMHESPANPPFPITETAPVSFTYDAAGNRKEMTDGAGNTTYQYDQLSRMTSETRTFTGLGAFTLNYAYNLAGQLTGTTDPWSAQIGYTRDNTGRLTAVTGDGFASGTDYSSEMKYRAWGGLKSMSYGNGIPLVLTYSNRLQLSNYKLTSTSTQAHSPSMDIDYSYHPDGQLKLSKDTRDGTLDRAYNYDHAGRLVDAFTASEARSWVQNGAIGTTVDGPYRQNYTMDAWNNMTTKWGRSWTAPNSVTQSVNHTYSATTGRNSGWAYDADGRMLGDDISGTSNMYDEAGGLRVVSVGDNSTLFTQDGDGLKVKMVIQETYATHYLRSSVLGETIAEINGDSTRKNGFVYADGELIATQSGPQSTGNTWMQAREVDGQAGQAVMVPEKTRLTQ
jgi:YD repeat-containing protein